ncbi:MAG TPA: alpha/beta hydrolase [Mucilaginibacter sp.]|nr:alpha/beta hydrolase [Mucilaginibacter sp.]
MAAAKVNDIEIAYETTGKGVPLVLIHGHPFDYTMWYPQVEAFSKNYKVITPDLRGYGKSSLPAGEITRFEDYATDVLLLLDQLKVDRFHLAGLSMGGQVIMEIFRQAPDRIRTLIFADTFAGLDSPEVKQGRYDTATRLENEGMDAYAEEVIYKMIKPAHVSSMPEVAAHVIKIMKAPPPKAAATALRARAERIDYLAEVLPQINVPTLVIVGREDEFTPVAKAEELKENLQNCKLVIIEDAGHIPNLEHPEEFNKAVLDFLERVNYPESSF